MNTNFMCKRDYTTEDFVLDPEFQKWVLSPDRATKTYWEGYTRENPRKQKEMMQARRLVLNMSRRAREVEEGRIEDTWNHIDQAVDKLQLEIQDKKVIPLDSSSTLRHFESRKSTGYHRSMQFYRLVGILVVAFTLSFLVNVFFPQPVPKIVEIPVVYEEHVAPPGVKSNLTLQDGSKVILNSGSSLRYIKNFEPHQRIVELRGEAFFEIAKETERPFTVRTGPVSTTALGTSFNIKAYDNKSLDISLLTGRVLVQRDSVLSQPVNLQKGEGLEIDLNHQEMKRVIFDQDRVLAWTKKTIVFDQSPMWEIKRVLENWYGVSIRFSNSPHPNLEVSGRFQDQTLKNVLEGLSYSARFEFTIDKDRVTLVFN
ncbi:FecR family protein [Cyclobacterium sp. SYSU L10401]|uniref:FecR family protein n=2 Tax=unclassified Cyclobacterium TaxID=2615055 RepID=UPI0013D3E22A|nr:FecR family protein [Cyclobacterium sp. SYSU L10401]